MSLPLATTSLSHVNVGRKLKYAGKHCTVLRAYNNGIQLQKDSLLYDKTMEQILNPLSHPLDKPEYWLRRIFWYNYRTVL